VKQKLAANRTTTPLFDRARFARNIEAAYLAMLSAR
jgi:predicted O-linked N-acetylglucosamine transferase (SPINDLY family)